MMENKRILTVSQLNLYVKSLLDSSSYLKGLYISGEISNFTNHVRTGHLYMTLKDDKSAVKAVMFNTAASKLAFTPQSGMKVICSVRVSLYERDGTYQLYIDSMQPDGIGALAIAFEQLKQKLFEEGLFDERHKKPIPYFPRSVALITSKTGAAVEDMKNVLSRRNNYVRIIICDSAVQGENAHLSLIKSIEAVNRIKCADTIIIGRGGGSIEDLWEFNSEALARAVFNSNIPVISAVGHETDYTICDFVSDLRAPTPSAAAELAVPHINEVLGTIEYYRTRYKNALEKTYQNKKSTLELILSKPPFINPSVIFNTKKEQISNINQKLNTFNLDTTTVRLDKAIMRIEASSPYAIFKRGYSIVTDTNNNILSDINKFIPNTEIKITTNNGQVPAMVLPHSE